ncbi:error-prone DNA polymerase [Flavipsychrobacter stenotrophus]|uniref:Error-prone DNA polymerase n=1 Tax=Flavipsychrobacter stenotrophus TaxID=2077091 RepID=A0A2S7SR60_9BACT|nr:error-prone DNA polymerase [Flavipsychrobacter stenotrophus]PQJ09390.1 error-prone DNA polymerase [Flavipsychrobacter stenotrophus]
MDYTELQVTTNFSFLRGGSHPEEMVEAAAALGYSAIAITDVNTLAGIVRAYAEAKKQGVRIIPACRLDLIDGHSLLAYPTDKEAYGRLSGLLSEGNRRTEKGQCHLYKKDVYQYSQGIKFIIPPPAALDASFDFDPAFVADIQEYRQALGSNVYLGATRSYQANDSKKLFRLSQLSEQFAIPLIATNDVHYHIPERRELQDVPTCIREKCTIHTAGFRLYQNAERHLKTKKEMLRLFQQYPDAICRAQELAEACTFSLNELKYIYPEEITSEGRTPQEELVHLTWQGAKEKFGETIPNAIRQTIQFELEFMERKNYASYFLTVYDFVSFARDRNILCQGRGSAANSVVCYCLGITSVNPSKFKLLFARFMSDARDEPPDIDVDFEHERREEVIQYIYQKYGRDRAAIVATVTQVHFKGAVRDVAKAMGLSVDAINRLSDSSWEFTDDWFAGKGTTSDGFDPNDSHLMKVLQLTRQYIGFPRQLGQHTGGFIITQGKLSDLCPILNARMENRTCIEWNKDDIEALGFLKVDVLALGMLTCIRKTFDLCKAHYGLDLTLANIPQDDPLVYEMICHADTIGVFQIESRAQMSMLPRLKPKCFYDLVIEVAIVRPGPIQGDMVHPYLRRREGKEPIEYPKEELRNILGRTCGVPLFQEQAMEIAIVAAGFTPAEADGLRRSMATFKAKGKVSDWHKKLVAGMTANGYTEEFANRVFKQLEGFGSYGFPESHAASFALLVYISSWVKCYYPDVFAAGLLNSMPMGFYQPAQIVIDAQKHGVEVLPVDINYSYWDNTLAKRSGKYYSLRLGFRQVKGLREEEMVLLTSNRSTEYTTIASLRDPGLPLAVLEKLADADAFRSIGLDRRQALWEVSALADRPTGIFTGQQPEVEEGIQLPEMSLSEHVLQDYGSVALSVKAHPVSFIREKLLMLQAITTNDLTNCNDGAMVKIAGLVLVRQRPGTASGICFITIEDETGVANLVVFKKLFDKYRKEIVRSRLLLVEGKIQKEGEVIHVVARRCSDISALLRQLSNNGMDGKQVHTPLRADENGEDMANYKTLDTRVKKVVQGDIFYGGRNFR